MAKRKIRFIKPWGNYKVGDTIENPSEVTVRTLCFKHRFAELVGDPVLQAQIEREKKTLEALRKDFTFELDMKQQAVVTPSVAEKTKVDKDIEEAIESVEPAKEEPKEPPVPTGKGWTETKGPKKKPARKRTRKSTKKSSGETEPEDPGVNQDPGDLIDGG